MGVTLLLFDCVLWLFWEFLSSGFGLVCCFCACSLISTSLTSIPLIGRSHFCFCGMCWLHALDLSCEFLDLLSLWALVGFSRK